MGDPVLGAEADYLFAGKVHSIVIDDSVGEPEATHYILPEELGDLFPSDFREQDCLDPFGEVVGGHYKKSQLRLHLGEWSNHVQPPLHYGQGTV